jgi:biofilm PGA synthesis N-glycosyltransferase PgaC
MLSLIILFFSTQVGIAILLFYGKNRLKKDQNSVQKKTTVLIPFRNEKDRILPLLQSINQSIVSCQESNFQFIFIDDHSSDDTTQFIIDNLDTSFQILKLNRTSGKKYAIKRGVEHSTFNRILTLDADVSFDKNYLLEISKTECKNLTILPVEMYGNTLVQKLFSVEFWFLQRLTFGCAGLGKYELCNGANLLFTKNTFFESLKLRTDADVPSGDDMFLLNVVKKLNLDIQAVNNKYVTVRTPAARNFTDLLNQRLRWVSKTNDSSSLIGGVIVLISNLIFLFCLVHITLGNFIYVLPILLKITSEWMSVDSKSKLSIVILHQLYYPFYILVIIYKLIFKSNYDWK